MTTNKRKTTTAIIATVTAVVLLLSGTFAWTSISQQAKNETAGIVNVGGRLHDDFNGTNKDVYVENFTDPLNGGQPIYARVRLDEYMEVGSEAGQADNADRKAVPVVSDTDINDVKTWTPHVPSESCAVCATEGTCKIHDHWKWIMGGEGDNNGQTTFMPTFNKDKDSLAADINGTYHGTDNTDKVYYDDYVVYTTDANGLANVPQADIAARDGEILSVDGNAYYDDDADHEKNDHDQNIGAFKTEPETHTAKQTATATVKTMQQWINEGSQPGNFWVYDTDGWAYWANPIMPGEATGLLLDGINMTKNPGEKCYYAINVVAQFSTVNDWDEFYTDEDSKTPDMSEEAKEVLKAAAANVATVTVTNVENKTTVRPGDIVTFSAKVTVNGVQVLVASDFNWSVLNADLTESTSSTITDGVLTVGDEEYSQNLIIVAKAKDEAYLGALGLTSVAVPPTNYGVVVSAKSDTVDVGNTLNLSAVVTKNGETDTSGVNWSVDSTAGSTVSANGVLTVSAGEKHNAVLTVTASSVEDVRAVGTYSVTVYNGYELLKDVPAGSTEKVRIDNMEWYVLVQDESEGRALIWAAEASPNKTMAFASSTSVWRDSAVRTYMNGEYYNSLKVLNIHALETVIYTASDAWRNNGYIETKDKVFLLSEADVYGTINGGGTPSNSKEFTYGSSVLVPESIRHCSNRCWLRSPHEQEGSWDKTIVAVNVNVDNRFASCDRADRYYLRPAMWVDLGE